MKLYIGQAKVIGPISRYAGRFNFLELAAEPGRCPRPAILKRWLEEVPSGFAFSVRLGRAVGAFDSGAEDAIAMGLRAAEALEAKWILLQTPATLGPGQRNRERLRKLFARLVESGRHIAWDPRGVWDEEDILPLISEVDVQWARDASRYEMVEEPLAYARIPALGSASRVGLGLAERAGENLRGFEEAYVVIEGEGAGRAAQIIREIANQPVEDDTVDQADGDADGVEELSMKSARTVVGMRRPAPAVSEDEELDDEELDDEELDDEELDDEELDDEELDDEELDDEELDDEELDDEELDDEELDDEEANKPEGDEDAKPETIDDSDLPWSPKAKGKRSR